MGVFMGQKELIDTALRKAKEVENLRESQDEAERDRQIGIDTTLRESVSDEQIMKLLGLNQSIPIIAGTHYDVYLAHRGAIEVYSKGCRGAVIRTYKLTKIQSEDLRNKYSEFIDSENRAFVVTKAEIKEKDMLAAKYDTVFKGTTSETLNDTLEKIKENYK